MKVTAFAERVLFGERLEDKFFWPDTIEYGDDAVHWTAPRWPGRPPALRLDRPQTRVPFPRLGHDSDESTRGRVLHFFANHELLAIELMAVFLLRFPDAPKSLRRAVAYTIREEQEHMRLYMARMADFGVALGEVSVSAFFWETLRNMSSPNEYLAGMSLTLEQANLDFCTHYLQAFERIGDDQSATLMRKVRDDEIGHVRLGALWFERLKADDPRDLWPRYCDSLIPPLTPARARGIGFDREARELAGLPTELIDRVAVFAHSKGRAPDVYMFNPSSERFAMRGVEYQPNETERRVAQDLGLLPAFLASVDDVVVVDRAPSVTHLASLAGLGFVLPQICTDLQELSGRALGSLRPWAVSPDSVRRLADLESASKSRLPAFVRQSFDKRWASALCRTWLVDAADDRLAPERAAGFEAASVEQVVEHVRAALVVGEAVVTKLPFSTAGRGMVRYFDDRDIGRNDGWLRRAFEQQGAVVVQPWLDRVTDFSVQFVVRDDGTTKVLGVTRFDADRRGQYRATWVTHAHTDLEPDVMRFVVGGGGRWWLVRALEDVAEFVGRHLYVLGHRGPAGVDAFVYRDTSGALRLQPLVEINPRCTMSAVALALRPRVAAGHSASLRIMAVADAMQLPHGQPPALDDRGLLTSGVVFLTEIDTDTRHVAVLDITS